MHIDIIDKTKIPQHVAVIMDGNGRWAKKHKQERFFGHKKGAESAKEVTEIASEIGVKYLTLYAFSKENWNRPEDEVHSLMGLLIQGVTENLDQLNDLNIKLKIIGDFENLPENVKKSVDDSIISTKDNTGMTLIIALNYGSRWEMIEAVKSIAESYKNNDITLNDIDDKLFSQRLTTCEIPDPDLLIRTSGEFRISNFLLWQISYSELFFSELYWPDFRKQQFIDAIVDYQKRERRFGKTSSQLKK
ncbi:MAG: isoprenyl transferase [Bacteroidales bacterium]|nr:isoprenyl transferase [Bacteroidales bacterium]